MKVGRLCRHITELGFALIEKGFALDAQVHVTCKRPGNRKSLMWSRDRNERLMIDDPSNVDCYLSLIERKDYSYLMNDGGVIQIAVTYHGREIVEHRLLYHPCPFSVGKIDVDEFEGGLLDFIHDMFMNDLEGNVLLRSPIRFDYAPQAATPDHPASHLTFNDPDCRIPVRSPLQVGAFIEFVFQNFYPDAWDDDTVVSWARQFRREDVECLTAHDRRRIYLNWESGRFGRQRDPRPRHPGTKPSRLSTTFTSGSPAR